MLAFGKAICSLKGQLCCGEIAVKCNVNPISPLTFTGDLDMLFDSGWGEQTDGFFSRETPESLVFWNVRTCWQATPTLFFFCLRSNSESFHWDTGHFLSNGQFFFMWKPSESTLKYSRFCFYLQSLKKLIVIHCQMPIMNDTFYILKWVTISSGPLIWLRVFWLL